MALVRFEIINLDIFQKVTHDDDDEGKKFAFDKLSND